tara:strand:- start:1343 stop:2395 length:1053 start_codon:yes stop_codon:yes gene_type:complete
MRIAPYRHPSTSNTGDSKTTPTILANNIIVTPLVAHLPKTDAMSNLNQPPSAAEVATYFQGNENTEYQERMIRECGQWVKTYPVARTVTNPHLLACHHRFCPKCQKRRAQNWASALRTAIDCASKPTSKSDLRYGPRWVAIDLPGVPCAVSGLRNQFDTLIDYLAFAIDQPFWRFGTSNALRLLRLEINQTAGQEPQVTPAFTCLVNISENLFNAQLQGSLIQRVRQDWIKPKHLDNWPGVETCLVPTATASDRDNQQKWVMRMIESAYPYPDGQTFLKIADQLKGMKTVALHRTQRTPFRPSHISQADDLRYEREYSLSRIGEDLQESLNCNRGVELLPYLPWEQLNAL